MRSIAAGVMVVGVALAVCAAQDQPIDLVERLASLESDSRGAAYATRRRLLELLRADLETPDEVRECPGGHVFEAAMGYSFCPFDGSRLRVATASD